MFNLGSKKENCIQIRSSLRAKLWIVHEIEIYEIKDIWIWSNFCQWKFSKNPKYIKKNWIIDYVYTFN